ncbi:pulmonary surfactant-associated protein D-like [Bombina bombina]|uniref:pulmonary surfactant-associated protein D-like n=1 Tax=Bombina bombina TaxID=8345 RepID=UPI00235AAD08|nr:pulmonary surfactant-associated protein D-like [Bombina bombina]
MAPPPDVLSPSLLLVADLVVMPKKECDVLGALVICPWASVLSLSDPELVSGVCWYRPSVFSGVYVALLFSRGASAGDKLFITNGEESNYNDASLTCHRAGGQLASPANFDENYAVEKIVSQYNKLAYLGINDFLTEGRFMYPNGNLIFYSNWNINEPNNDKGVEECVEMLTNGKWNDTTCKKQHLIICEFS